MGRTHWVGAEAAEAGREAFQQGLHGLRRLVYSCDAPVDRGPDPSASERHMKSGEAGGADGATEPALLVEGGMGLGLDGRQVDDFRVADKACNDNR